MWPNTTAPLEIDGLLGWIALSLPLFLLATLIALVVGRWRMQAKLAHKSGAHLDGEDHKTAMSERLGAALRAMKISTEAQDVLGASQAGASFSVLSRAGGLTVLEILEGAKDRTQAIEALGALVFEARRNGNTDVQAAARFHLGDLAEDAGDMTTACEHWQIARDLFHESDNSLACELAEEKMHSNGCPTDWVLNEF
ncbi:MAG: hypothetical protein ACRBCJ_04900 [Hyphomicrobiaceae bacterium]